MERGGVARVWITLHDVGAVLEEPLDVPQRKVRCVRLMHISATTAGPWCVRVCACVYVCMRCVHVLIRESRTTKGDRHQ